MQYEVYDTCILFQEYSISKKKPVFVPTYGYVIYQLMKIVFFFNSYYNINIIYTHYFNSAMNNYTYRFLSNYNNYSKYLLDIISIIICIKSRRVKITTIIYFFLHFISDKYLTLLLSIFLGYTSIAQVGRYY